MIRELKQTEKYFENEGMQSPGTEAEQIFCLFFNCKRIDLYTSDISLSLSQRQSLHELIERRIKGEPLQYILGKAEFYGFEFKIQKGVFIPRPETEILIDAALKKLTTYNLQLTTNILDLCTGCGNIAISLTKYKPRYRMFASDISEKCMHLAKENTRLNKVSNNIEFRCGDLFSPWSKRKEFFDAIVCNPPYIKSKELKDLPCDVKNEPAEALDAGGDGLRFYSRIIEEAPLYLKEKAYLFFELSPQTAKDVKEILSRDFTNIEIVKDYNFMDRVIVGQLKGHLIRDRYHLNRYHAHDF